MQQPKQQSNQTRAAWGQHLTGLMLIAIVGVFVIVEGRLSAEVVAYQPIGSDATATYTPPMTPTFTLTPQPTLTPSVFYTPPPTSTPNSTPYRRPTALPRIVTPPPEGVIEEPPPPDMIFQVNTTDDSNDGTCDENHCSLADAIIAANQQPATNLNYILLPEDTYLISGELPVITSTIAVFGQGDGAVIDGGSPIEETNLFSVASGGDLRLYDLTIQNGFRGVYNRGSLTVLRSHFLNNRTTLVSFWNPANSNGAGIYHDGPFLSVFESTFIDNEVEWASGAAIHLRAYEGDVIQIKSSFFRGNRGFFSGAIYYSGSAPITLTGNIFVGNSYTAVFSEGSVYSHFTPGTGDPVPDHTVKNNCFTNNLEPVVDSYTPAPDFTENWWGATNYVPENVNVDDSKPMNFAPPFCPQVFDIIVPRYDATIEVDINTVYGGEWPFTFSIIQQPTFGTLTPVGDSTTRYTYESNVLRQANVDVFYYQVEDSRGVTAFARVYIVPLFWDLDRDTVVEPEEIVAVVNGVGATLNEATTRLDVTGDGQINSSDINEMAQRVGVVEWFRYIGRPFNEPTPVPDDWLD